MTDYAAGTSSRSSKLVHGGLRYLQNFDLGLVREALLERRLMVKLAPHLVTPLQMVVPAFGGARPDRLVGIGLNMYDVMSTPRFRGRREARRAARQLASRTQREEEPDSEWSPDRHRTISGPEVLELLPALAERQPARGYLFYDCQTDDVRLVLTVLSEAERFGAICANRMKVVEVLNGRGPGDSGAGDADRGVRVLDRERDEEIVIRAANVINATGVWADQIRPEELESEAEVPRIAPSRGTHVLLATADLPLRAGAIVPAGEGRSIFALPWMGRSLLGTTDNNYEGPIDHIQPSSEDIRYLLKATNQFFETEFEDGDLVGAYAGVRPLISSGDMRKSVDISRKAELYETSSGMVTITGGKLTTWRRMAKLTVDRIAERDGREAPCRTQEIPLGQPIDPGALLRVDGVQADTYDRLAHRYGHAAEQVLVLAGERPELAARIVPDLPDLLAEAAYAARHEQARTVGDVLLRRTRLGLLAGRAVSQPDSDVPARVATVVGEELGWDAARVQAEVRGFEDEAKAEGLGA